MIFNKTSTSKIAIDSVVTLLVWWLYSCKYLSKLCVPDERRARVAAVNWHHCSPVGRVCVGLVLFRGRGDRTHRVSPVAGHQNLASKKCYHNEHQIAKHGFQGRIPRINCIIILKSAKKCYLYSYMLKKCLLFDQKIAFIWKLHIALVDRIDVLYHQIRS